LRVQLAFKAFHDIECIGEAGFEQRLRGSQRSVTASAQKEHDVIAPDLRFDLSYKARISLQCEARHERHMDTILDSSDKLPFFGRTNLDQHGRVGREQLPGIQPDQQKRTDGTRAQATERIHMVLRTAALTSENAREYRAHRAEEGTIQGTSHLRLDGPRCGDVLEAA
jgi:hypothetical protein